ncbi:MAG: PAS domain-containing hybrid sensor histidine kinase/response regulator [Candidatus Methylomirabilia bacterium]
MDEQDRTQADLTEDNAALRRRVLELERAEAALRESEERCRILLFESPDPTFSFTPEGRYLFVNKAFAEGVGKPPEQIIGRTIWDVFPRDEADKRFASLSQVFRTGEAKVIEVRVPRPDGDRYYITTISPIKDGRGSVLSAVCSSKDITERKTAEQTRQEGEELLRTLFEHSPISMAIVGLDGKIEHINRRAVETFGFLPEEIPTMDRWWHLAYPDEAYRAQVIAQWLGLAAKAMEGNGEIERREYRVTCKDGTAKTMIIFGVLAAGKVFVMFEDISSLKLATEERLNLERQLLHAQKLESLGILAGGIAHDFNNLLTAILGNTDLALAELPPPSTVRPLVEQIQTASLRAAELTRQMLVFAGRGELATVTLDLSATVREMVQLLAASLSKKAELRLDLAEGLPPIEADPAQLRQIVMNFILNASDAIGEQTGVIAVRTGRNGRKRHFTPDFCVGTLPPGGDTVFLEIADSGCGIDAATLPRIFDPFFTTKFTGRGLGLAAAQGIILRHSGTLEVRSRAGEGSVFRVVFPASAGTAAPGMPAPAAAAAPLPHAAERSWWGSGIVLLVDDEAPVRHMAARMLTALGFDVLTAADGAEAVALFGTRAGEIRAVLLDLTMPRMDGHEAFLALRRLRAGVPVVLCSGYDVRESAERFSGLAFSGFLQKPYRLEELKAVLKKVLGG